MASSIGHDSTPSQRLSGTARMLARQRQRKAEKELEKRKTESLAAPPTIRGDSQGIEDGSQVMQNASGTQCVLLLSIHTSFRLIRDRSSWGTLISDTECREPSNSPDCLPIVPSSDHYPKGDSDTEMLTHDIMDDVAMADVQEVPAMSPRFDEDYPSVSDPHPMDVDPSHTADDKVELLGITIPTHTSSDDNKREDGPLEHSVTSGCHADLCLVTECSVDANDDVIDVNDNIIDLTDDVIDFSDDVIDVNDDIVDISDDVIDVNDDIVDISDDVVDVSHEVIDLSELDEVPEVRNKPRYVPRFCHEQVLR